LSAGTVAAKAQGMEFGVGPHGVYVGPNRHYHEERYSDEAEYGRCRIVITHRTNRFGEEVEVRRRICD
jgi:hypothetical protein